MLILTKSDIDVIAFEWRQQYATFFEGLAIAAELELELELERDECDRIARTIRERN